jgi:hypothetical protein
LQRGVLIKSLDGTLVLLAAAMLYDGRASDCLIISCCFAKQSVRTYTVYLSDGGALHWACYYLDENECAERI